MTTRELIDWSQALYRAITEADISLSALGELAVAIRSRTPWQELSSGARLSVMKIATRCAPGESTPVRTVIDLPPDAVSESCASSSVRAETGGDSSAE